MPPWLSVEGGRFGVRNERSGRHLQKEEVSDAVLAELLLSLAALQLRVGLIERVDGPKASPVPRTSVNDTHNSSANCPTVLL